MLPESLQLVMPVHNEGLTIAATLHEWHDVLRQWVTAEFIICEDGSRDNSQDVLRCLSRELPIQLHMTRERRGYGPALISGILASETEWVATVDSDGQAYPSDFPKLLPMRYDCDLVIGWRVNRADHWVRKLMSVSFKLLHRALFGTKLHDPSCNVMLMRRTVIEDVLPKMGLMVEGFQWELVARALRSGYRICEVPIRHRPRAAGGSRVFRPRSMPGIAWRNVVGLLRVRFGDDQIRHHLPVPQQQSRSGSAGQ